MCLNKYYLSLQVVYLFKSRKPLIKGVCIVVFVCYSFSVYAKARTANTRLDVVLVVLGIIGLVE